MRHLFHEGAGPRPAGPAGGLAAGTWPGRGLGLSGAEACSPLVTAGLLTAGVAALVAGAWMSVPFYPVPLTMQTLAVLVVGGLLGPRLGVAAVLAYLALGLAGAPVFHGGVAGPAVLLGPTGGYLLGFVPAAFVVGLFAQRARRTPVHAAPTPLTAEGAGRHRARGVLLLAGGAVLAEAAIYLVGVPWLAVAYTGGDLSRAMAIGAVPYLLGDLLKVAVAIGVLRRGAGALARCRLLP